MTIPDRITRVLSTSPPVTYMLYAIDRTMLVGLNDRLTEEQKQFLHPDVHNLHVVGGWFGQGNI